MKAFIRTVSVVSALLAASTGNAQEAVFPERPIQIISTTTPGSQSDTLIRVLSNEASKSLGQPIVIITKASAAGTVGADQARRANADGYTIFLGGNTTMAANVHLFKKLSYDPLGDFAPITMVTTNPLVLVVRAGLPVHSVKELVDYGKANPGKLNYGVGNSGNQVAVGLLKKLTGMKAAEIPYNGAAPAMLDLVAGRVDFMISDPLVADPFVKQGTIRALAITAPMRLPSMNALPSMTEAGISGYREITTFLSLYAPRGTPKPVICKLHDAFVSAINSPEGQRQFEKMGMVRKTSSPEELGAFNKEQAALWGQLVKVSGIEPQ
jgi:tripartite-type tricarboxylate transporter receptor subunit TctC